jgi:hypothetical protein
MLIFGDDRSHSRPAGVIVSKTLVITQSNFIPWRGYFDLLRSADEVVLLDCVQYTRRDWRNRNRIKTANGPVWLTIPVETKGRYDQAIDETRIANSDWIQSHIRSIEVAYRGAAHYQALAPWLFDVMAEIRDEPFLTKVNARLLRAFCRRLDIDVALTQCTDLLERGALRSMDPTARLVQLAKAAGASRYLSGPAAKDYLDVAAFEREGIEVAWMDYTGYPEYPQLWGGFEPFVSIVDLVLNVGDRAAKQYLAGAAR